MEEVLGHNQDIEWTLVSGVPWVLQARPITTLRHSVDAEDWAPDDRKTWKLDWDTPLLPLEEEVTIRRTHGAKGGNSRTG